MNHDEADNYFRLWDQATFMPHDLPSRSGMLLESVAKKLQSNFLALCLWVSAVRPDLYAETGMAQYLAQFQALEPEKRRQLVECPLFRIWLKQATRALVSGIEVRNALLELKRVIEVFGKEDGHVTLATDCGTIELVQFSPDRLILQAPQKDYSFPDEARRKELEQGAYSIPLFVESVQGALQRVRTTWFEAFRDFFRFVKVVVDLIDVSFTSYSSRELTGVIFVSTHGDALFLEECLIHEFGHQILDNVMELDPLVDNKAEQMFKLPWSDREREIYGYFHAFFIYILLANYYSRIRTSSMGEQEIVSERMTHILDGLRRATPELEAADLFTPRGKHLFMNLKREAHRLSEEQPAAHPSALATCRI